MIDLNRSPALQGGPYILGKQFNGHAVLWGHSFGALPSIPLLFQPSGGGPVVGRALSNSLVIPMGSILWRNSRLHSIAGLCGNPAGWSDFNITRVSPDNNLLAGSAKLGGVPHSAVFLPYQFKEVYPSSGFDGESEPNWLMIPKDGENYAKAFTPANGNTPSLAYMEVSFRVGPDPGSGSVYPALAYSSPETITVGSSDLGDSTAVQIGLGTAFGSGGLNLSVKKYQTKTVALHAVTQQDGGGSPNALCIGPGANGVIDTNPGGDDTVGGGGIRTGGDGLCQTTKQGDDVQILRPAIIPQHVPTTEQLQEYLNTVFGVQTNTYFTVTRTDKVVDYDINRDGELNMSGTVNLVDEEFVLQNEVQDPNPEYYNIYFVKAMHYFTMYGSNAAGKALDELDIAYMEDFSSDIDDVHLIAAHELGHCMGLPHAENKTGLTYLSDRDPNKRLMYGRGVSNTLLIKSEWDIINDDSEN